MNEIKRFMCYCCLFSFCLSHKKFVNNFQFFKKDKAIVITGHQNLDDKLVMECVRFKM